MKVFDTTVLSKEQLDLLALLIKHIGEWLPPESLGRRARLSNLRIKK